MPDGGGSERTKPTPVRYGLVDWAVDASDLGSDGQPTAFSGALSLLNEITTDAPELLAQRGKAGRGCAPERASIDIRSKEAAHLALELRRRFLSRREAEDAVLHVMGVALSAIDKYTGKALRESIPAHRPMIARFRAIKERLKYTAARSALTRRQQIAWEGMREGSDPVALPKRRRVRRA